MSGLDVQSLEEVSSALALHAMPRASRPASFERLALEPAQLARQLLAEVAPGQEHPYDEGELRLLGNEVRRSWVSNLHAPLSQLLEVIQQDREAQLTRALLLHAQGDAVGTEAFERLANGLLETAELTDPALTHEERRRMIEVNPALLLDVLSDDARDTVYAALAYAGSTGLIGDEGW